MASQAEHMSDGLQQAHQQGSAALQGQAQIRTPCSALLALQYHAANAAHKLYV